MLCFEINNRNNLYIKMKNYDNFDLYDIVQKRNDVIDLKQNLQNYVQRF